MRYNGNIVTWYHDGSDEHYFHRFPFCTHNRFFVRTGLLLLYDIIKNGHTVTW